MDTGGTNCPCNMGKILDPCQHVFVYVLKQSHCSLKIIWIHVNTKQLKNVKHILNSTVVFLFHSLVELIFINYLDKKLTS